MFDACVTDRSEDLASFYTVKNIAVKRMPDRWTAEALIEANPISGEVPSTGYPWGDICRQRLAGNAPEFYMLFPSGTNVKDPRAMGNLVMRHCSPPRIRTILPLSFVWVSRRSCCPYSASSSV